MMDMNLNELTLDNFEIWPQKVKTATVFVLCIVIIALGYWILIKPHYQEYETVLKQEKQLRIEFESKQRLAANLNAYRNQFKQMQTKFGSLLGQLPNKDEMDKLLEEISRTGVASGLKFELFDPGEEQTHDFYIELPIGIIVIGSYHQLAVFLSRVASMGRIVTLHDLNITYADKEQRGNELKMTITARIYRYKIIQ